MPNSRCDSLLFGRRRQAAACADASADSLVFVYPGRGQQLGCGLLLGLFGVFMGYYLIGSVLQHRVHGAGSILEMIWVLVLSLFALAMGYAGLAGVEELSVDLSQHRYQVRRGTWPWVRVEVGSLSEVSRLRIVVRPHYFGKHGEKRVDYYEVMMEWKNDRPEQFTLKWEPTDRDADFWPTASSLEESQTKTKNELEAYATALAARLLVPVIDDTKSSDFSGDLKLMWETEHLRRTADRTDGANPRASTDRAINAAARVFNTVLTELFGKRREEVLALLGDPKSSSDSTYNSPVWPAPEGSLVYRFDNGAYGWQFNVVVADDDRVREVQRRWISDGGQGGGPVGTPWHLLD